MAAGLKLTNTVYAVALYAGFYVSPGSLGKRFLNAILFGVGVLPGMAVTGGYWHYEMWRAFGNPLYPQYSAFFPNLLTHPIQVADTASRPKTLFETVFWPFIFSIDSQRVGQLQIRQIIWPVVYVLFWFWLVVSMLGKRIKGSPINAVLPSTYVISVVMIGYLVWMKFFSIQRYLVPIEVLTPLTILVMLNQITTFQKARKIAIYTLVATTAVVLLGSLRTWGHAPWSEKIFRIDLPPLEKPVTTTVIMVGGDSAFGLGLQRFFHQRSLLHKYRETFLSRCQLTRIEFTKWRPRVAAQYLRYSKGIVIGEQIRLQESEGWLRI
jgi:hypothetical protein